MSAPSTLSPHGTRPRRVLALTAASVALALGLAGCAGGDAPAGEETAAAPTTVTVQDNHGTHEIALPLTSVVALDNGTFETLSDWGVELSAAAVSLMPDTIPYVQDGAIVDIGTHNEPNLELIVAAQPDLVIVGQRFQGHYDDIVALVPEATVLQLDPREGEPFLDELKRQAEVLGEVFGKQAEAAQLAGDLDAAIARVEAAYDPAETVMSVITSGGEIGYSAPGNGRTFGPLYDVLGLTPALQVDESSEDHQGDEISVEAIADSNPSWILVMDRDAAISADDPAYVPSAEVIEKSEALAKVRAVVDGNIVYMPADTYTNEGIQTYTEFLNAFADALEAARR